MVSEKTNIWGQYLFTFQLIKDGKLLPMGADGTEYQADKYCSKISSSNLNGIACTQKALTEANYWNGI